MGPSLLDRRPQRRPRSQEMGLADELGERARAHAHGERPGRAGALRSRAFPLVFPWAVRALNTAGLGPLRSELSTAELRRAGLRAASEVVERLRIDARDVILDWVERAVDRGARRDEILFHLSRQYVRWHRLGHVGAAKVYRDA